MKTKYCRDCKKMLPENQFYSRILSSKRSFGKIYFRPNCKACRNLQDKERYHEHREEKIAYQRAYNLRTKDKRKELGKKYYIENRDRINKVTEEWRKNNPEKARQQRKNWRTKNPQKSKQSERKWRTKNSEKYKLITRAVNARYRARKKNVLGDFTLPQWKYLLDFYGHQCMMCGTGKDLTIDYVIPISKGGMHSIENIQILCQACNSHKGTKIMDLRKIFTHPIPFVQTKLFQKGEPC